MKQNDIYYDYYLCYYCFVGEWKVSILGPDEHVDANTRRQVLALYGTATTVDSSSYQAWHCWGLANVRAIDEAKLLLANTGLKTPATENSGKGSNSNHTNNNTTSSGPGSHTTNSNASTNNTNNTNNTGSDKRTYLSPMTVPLTHVNSGNLSPSKRSRSATQVNLSSDVVTPLAVNAIHGLMRGWYKCDY